MIRRWWRNMNFHGRNWVRELFLRPGVRVYLCGRTATIVSRDGYRNVTVKPEFDRDGNVNVSETQTWWMGNLRIVL